MAYKNLILDFGKVLVDWSPRYLYDSYFGDADKCNSFLDDVLSSNWYYDSNLGIPMDFMVKEWSRRYPEYAKAFEAYVNRFPETIKGEIRGMNKLLKDLKAKGIKLYGLSNTSAELYNMVADKYPIFGLLDGKVLSGEVHLIKPNPGIYRLLLDKYKLNAEECLFVDDKQVNVDAAIAVGMGGHLFKNATKLKALLEEK